MLRQLNGHMTLIKGNHDYRSLFKFLKIKHNETLSDGKKDLNLKMLVLLKFGHHQFYCTHYPLLLGKVEKIINLHGHIHHYAVPIPENINVGSMHQNVTTYLRIYPWGSPLRGENF